MPVYEYVGISLAGKVLGSVPADNITSAKQILSIKGIKITRIKKQAPVSEKIFWRVIGLLQISLEQKLFKNTFLSINKGFVMSPDSHFYTSSFGVGLKYYIDRNGIISEEKSFSKGKFKGIEVITKQDLYFNTKRDGNPTENLHQISLQINLNLNKNIYVTGQTSFANFGNAGAYAEGIVGLNYTIKGVLNNKMEPVMPSLEGNGTLSVKQVKMKGFKLLNVVSAKTENPDIKDPDISKVDIKTTIKNNLVTIERFKFKVAGFRLRFEGQTSLDGKLNLKMRIGLPPLGIIGIPIKVLGTQENPDIKLGRKSEDLEETEYVDGITPINTTIPATPTPTIQNDSIPKTELIIPKNTNEIPTPIIQKDSIPKAKPIVPVEKVED